MDTRDLTQRADRILDVINSLENLQDYAIEEKRQQLIQNLELLRNKIGELKKNDPVRSVVDVHGIPVYIEWPKASYRTYGPGNYSCRMAADYGYIPNTKSSDGMELDVFIGPDTNSTKVFIVNQFDPKNNLTQEKIMLGFHTEPEAEMMYRQHIDEQNPSFCAGVKEIPFSELKERVFGTRKEFENRSISPTIDPAKNTANRVIAVDFDNTIAYCKNGNPIGDLLPNVKDSLQKLKDRGYRIIIWSGRNNKELPDTDLKVVEMTEYLNNHGIPYDEIDIGAKGKVIAEHYIDDLAIPFKNNWIEIVGKIINEDESSVQKGPMKRRLVSAVVAGLMAAHPGIGAARAVKPNVKAPAHAVASTKPVPHSEDPFIDTVSQLESSRGKNVQHQLVTYGINRGMRAVGAYGMMPLTAETTVRRSKNPKVAALRGLNPDQLRGKLAANPELAKEFAREHANYLNTSFKGDISRKLYAWKNGPRAAMEAKPEQIASHPYVKAGLQYMQAQKQPKLKPTTISKPIATKPGISPTRPVLKPVTGPKTVASIEKSDTNKMDLLKIIIEGLLGENNPEG